MNGKRMLLRRRPEYKNAHQRSMMRRLIMEWARKNAISAYDVLNPIVKTLQDIGKAILQIGKALSKLQETDQ